jgi:hypothetical protein
LRSGELKWLMSEKKEGDMALKGRQPNMEEANHLADVSELGCVVCLNRGFNNPAEIHHTQGKTKPNAHLKILPLCFEHHRRGGDKEPISRHPYKKRFEEAYGTEEELLKQVEELIKEQKEYGYLDDLPF